MVSVHSIHSQWLVDLQAREGKSLLVDKFIFFPHFHQYSISVITSCVTILQRRLHVSRYYLDDKGILVASIMQLKMYRIRSCAGCQFPTVVVKLGPQRFMWLMLNTLHV